MIRRIVLTGVGGNTAKEHANDKEGVVDWLFERL
jgi:hypothetical protein